MNKTAGKVLGAGVGASLGYTLNSLDKSNKGPTIPEFGVKTVASYALYSYAEDHEDEILKNCVIGYFAFELIRLTALGRPKAPTSTDGVNLIEQNTGVDSLAETAKTNIIKPDFLQGVGSALQGLSSLLGSFKGDNTNG